MHLYEIQKTSTDEPICRVELETDAENRLTDTAAEGKDGMN